MTIRRRRPYGVPRAKVMEGKVSGFMGRQGGYPRAVVMEGKVSGFMGRQGGKASIRRKPRKKPAPSLEVMKDSPPRRVGVRREQAKIEPAGLSAAISAIVNNIMSMIFGER